MYDETGKKIILVVFRCKSLEDAGINAHYTLILINCTFNASI